MTSESAWKRWLAPGLLAQRLGRGDISNREAAYFLLGNMLLGTATYYSGLAWSNPPWTLLSLWEAALVTIVTVYGMMRCFEAAGGDSNPRFVIEFTCLSFPIGLWTTLTIWSTAWLLALAYRKWALVIVSPNSDFADLYIRLAARFDWFVTMLALVAWQIVFFVWMTKRLRQISAERQAPAR